jgi:tRNA-dihydrouridine synthase
LAHRQRYAEIRIIDWLENWYRPVELCENADDEKTKRQRHRLSKFEIEQRKRMANFFQLLKRPIFVQAPMIGVTDPAYRKIIAMCGPSDVAWTEFISASGLCREQRRAQLLPMLQRVDGERHCVAQLFGRVPEEFRDAAALVRELGFDGVDLNFGCPEKAVTNAQHAGAALINDFPLAQRIIRATKEGAQGLPVTVKTRIGFDSIVVDDWLRNLFECEPAAITLHLRTRSMMSATHARWNDAVVGAMTRERQRAGVATRLIANGDVDSLELGAALVEHFSIDGVMFGRALFGTPWLFDEQNRRQAANARSLRELLAERVSLTSSIAAVNADAADDARSEQHVIIGSNPPRVALTRTLPQVLDVIEQHIDAYEHLQQRSATLGSHVYSTWLLMRKHFRSYLLHFVDARPMRLALQESNNAAESRHILHQFRIERGLSTTTTTSSSSSSIYDNSTTILSSSSNQSATM